jgi:subtilase family serine protease
MISFKHRAWPGVLALVCVLTCLFAVAPLPGMNGQAFADTGPDLTINSISWSPEVPAIRETITFTTIVSNQGDSAAPLCDMDYYIDDCLIDTVNVASIPAGSTAVYQFTWQAQGGDHSIRAIIDSTQVVTETNEDNNVINYVFSVIAADLIIESITWSPQTVSMGETVTFTVEVKNQGNKSSSYTCIEFFIDGSTRGQRDCGQLEPGESKTITYIWTAQVGQHTLKATADILNQCTESDETNNDLTATYSTAAPDLIVTSIMWSPTNHTDTENVTVHFTVKNIGSGISPASRLDFYVDGVGNSQIYFNTLYPGYYDTKTISWFPGASEHVLSAVIDASNWIYESNESNNTYSVTMPAVNPADLLIYSITWTPAKPVKNDWITYTVTVKNQGSKTVGECYLEFYMSASYKVKKRVESLLPGGTASFSFKYFTSDTPLHVKAVVDQDNLVAESDETNNEMEASITLAEPTTVDFTIISLTCTPKNPAVGDEVSITARLKNNSSVKAGLSHLAYFIDGEILEIIPIRSMNAKNSMYITITWIASPGTHTIEVLADYNDYYYESDEANNTKEISVSVKSPDLAIQAITWSPEIPSQGDNVDITFTIINQGTYKSDGCYIDYYVDGVWIGNQYIEEINTGDTVTRTLPWTLANDYQSFKIIVDKENDVGESNESNNEKTVVIPAPDLIIESITYSPTEFSENDTITFVITVVNAGSTAAEASYLDLYINDVLQASLPVNSIPGGSTAEVVFEWTALSGQNIFKLFIDVSDDIVEINETNNEKSVTLDTLVQTEIEIPPETPAEATTDNATSNETQQENIIGIPEDDGLPPAQESEALPANEIDELSQLFYEETPLWQDILGSRWLVIGVAVAGVAAISVLLVLRKRARAY